MNQSPGKTCRKKRSRKGPSYLGILAEPIYVTLQGKSLLGALSDTDPEYVAKLEERLSALFELFEIDRAAPDAWQKMALALAARHVPGFRRKWPSRKATAWDDRKYGELLRAVNLVRARDVNGKLRPRKLGASETIRLLKKRGEPKFLARIAESTVRRRYEEAQARRKDHLARVRDPYHVVPAGAGYARIPRLDHPHWRDRLAKGDPEALAWEERLTSLLSRVPPRNS
jgi:hypothetical protein